MKRQSNGENGPLNGYWPPPNTTNMVLHYCHPQKDRKRFWYITHLFYFWRGTDNYFFETHHRTSPMTPEKTYRIDKIRTIDCDRNRQILNTHCSLLLIMICALRWSPNQADSPDPTNGICEVLCRTVAAHFFLVALFPSPFFGFPFPLSFLRRSISSLKSSCSSLRREGKPLQNFQRSSFLKGDVIFHLHTIQLKNLQDGAVGYWWNLCSGRGIW